MSGIVEIAVEICIQKKNDLEIKFDTFRARYALEDVS